jgi:hypothetical protein
MMQFVSVTEQAPSVPMPTTLEMLVPPSIVLFTTCTFEQSKTKIPNEQLSPLPPGMALLTMEGEHPLSP